MSTFSTLHYIPEPALTSIQVSMDDDELEAEKARIEEQIWKRRHANAKAQREEEECMLIAPAEGNS